MASVLRALVAVLAPLLLAAPVPPASAGSVLRPVGVRDGVIGAFRALAPRDAPLPAPKPNLVLIVTDDQRADTITPELMPKLNAELVADGVLFPSGFVSNPLCCPSRASILTGQDARQHGVLVNGRGNPDAPTGGVWAFDDRTTLATWLRNLAGYRTGFLGKYLNGYRVFSDAHAESHGGRHYVPPGWDRWYAIHAGAGHHGVSFIDEHGARVETDPGSCIPRTVAEPCPRQPPSCPNSTDRLRDEALAFIDEAVAAGEPFFLYLSPEAPHAPACPPLRHRGARAALPPHRPPSYDEGAPGRNRNADKPAWLRERLALDAAALDALRARQLESLLAVDDAVAAIAQKLRETGQDANTIVVYSSDNGFLWGEHGRTRKSCPYDECLQVPFVIRAPGVAPRARIERAPVVNVDLAPTFAALAGLHPAVLWPRPDGRSLVRLLAGTETTWRTEVVAEHWGSEPRSAYWQGIPTWSLVRGPRWKYVEYCTGEIELYDLTRDPFELTNVAASRPDVVESQALRLRELNEKWPAAIPFPCGVYDLAPDQ